MGIFEFPIVLKFLREKTSSRIVAAAQGFPLCGCCSTTLRQNLKLLSPCIGDEFYPRIICSSIEVEDNGLAVFIEDETLGRQFVHVGAVAVFRGDGSSLFAVKSILEIHRDILNLRSRC